MLAMPSCVPYVSKCNSSIKESMGAFCSSVEPYLHEEAVKSNRKIILLPNILMFPFRGHFYNFYMRSTKGLDYFSPGSSNRWINY